MLVHVEFQQNYLKSPFYVLLTVYNVNDTAFMSSQPEDKCIVLSQCLEQGR